MTYVLKDESIYVFMRLMLHNLNVNKKNSFGNKLGLKTISSCH